jgi:hypothetical protein
MEKTMIGRAFHSRFSPPVKEPLVESWLNALIDTRRRTRNALQGINPWDSIVELLRDKHKLLIGEPTAQKIYEELGGVNPQQPRTTLVKGRNLITGLPDQLEISSLEVQAVDNDQASIPYLDWSSETGGQTIGTLLYTIAANETNWLYVGVLQQSPPSDLEALFTHHEDEFATVISGKTLSQHWKRLDAVREQLFYAYREMTLEDFRRTRSRHQSYCSAEWVVHELCQFEAELRCEIVSLFAAAKEALDKPINEA